MSRANKNEVSQRHREEWQLFRDRILGPALETDDADTVKNAKQKADLLKTYQEGERKAHGFADEQGVDESLSIAWED